MTDIVRPTKKDSIKGKITAIEGQFTSPNEDNKLETLTKFLFEGESGETHQSYFPDSLHSDIINEKFEYFIRIGKGNGHRHVLMINFGDKCRFYDKEMKEVNFKVGECYI